jgi:hypothetical protein
MLVDKLKQWAAENNIEWLERNSMYYHEKDVMLRSGNRYVLYEKSDFENMPINVFEYLTAEIKGYLFID